MQLEQLSEQPFSAALPDTEVEMQEHRHSLSAAGALYFLILLGAALIRFTSLDSLPLSPAEAREALAVWEFLRPGTASFPALSPAYFTLTSLLVPILGASDTVVRLVPALFGLGMVALPWLLRRQLGTAGMLVVAVLLAVSPLSSTISRTAGGASIALFSVLLVFVSLVRARDDSSGRWIIILAAALALGLTSSPLFYGGMVTLGLVWAAAGPRLLAYPPDGLPGRSHFLTAALIGVGMLVLLSTRLLTYPAGLGASAQILGDWLGHFQLAGGMVQVVAPYLAAARYEMALVLLGLPAVAWAAARKDGFGMLCVIWLALILVLMLLQSGVLANALLLTIPGYLLIGRFSEHAITRPLSAWTGLLAAGIVLAGAVLFVNVARYLRISVYEQDLSNLWLGLLAVAAAALMLYYFWTMTDAAIFTAVWLAALTMLLLFQWGNAWRLGHRAANDPRERWVEEGTDNDLPVLLRTLTDISRQATNSDSGLTLLSSIDNPMLRWYLRDFTGAVFGQAIPPDAQHQVILGALDAPEPRFGADYMGSDFGLLRTGELPAANSSSPVADTLRWWFFDETGRQIAEQRIILWVRADLVAPDQ